MNEQKNAGADGAASIDSPYWQALDSGRLVYQRCECGHRWLPPRAECPNCLGITWGWQGASGRGRLISWVVYYVAYDDAFRNRIPYNVAIVELEEGVRLISNIIDCPDGAGLSRDMPVELSVTRDESSSLATFISRPQDRTD